MNHVIHPDVAVRGESLAEAFRSASFFPHVVIDRLVTAELCRGLVEEFPGFQSDKALNELGKVGTKACREDVRELGDSFVRLDDTVRSPEFLQLMSEISGIPDLLYDPEYIGGGTHDNVDRAELDIHVDFNYHPKTRWHRRLNLILFLSPEWQQEWGGCFELHRDPWSPDEDEVELVVPRFNRAVLFETSEISWHGFNRIVLPEGKKHLSRKSFALYLYTTTRPEEEIATDHATVYVPRPLPKTLQAGTVLSQKDVDQVKELVIRRDQQLRFLYEREKEFSEHIVGLKLHAENLERIIRERLPLKGHVQQVGEATGVWTDRWVGESLEFRFIPDVPITTLRLSGFVPDYFPETRRLTAEIGDAVFETEVGLDQFAWDIPVDIPAGSEVNFRARCSPTWSPLRAGQSSDDRELAFLLISIAAY